MADLNIWFGLASVAGADGRTLPALSASPGTSQIETLTNVTTSTQSQAAPRFFSGEVAANVSAIGGGVWIAVGDNPTAAANADGSIYVSDGKTISLSILPGQKIAAISA